MKIPKYWAQASRSVQDPEGKWFKLSTWRWSDSSTDEPTQVALARVKDLAASVQRGETLNHYSHGERPMREETIQTVAGGGSGELGVITRNAYGAVVLNAIQAMFVDIDFEPQGQGTSLVEALLMRQVRASRSPLVLGYGRHSPQCGPVEFFFLDLNKHHYRSGWC